MNFEFTTANRIIFGAGSIKNVGVLASPMGRRALVVSGTNMGRTAPLLDALSTQQIQVTMFSVIGEPTIELVQAGVELARAEGCDFVIGFGGGSSLDVGKAIAIMLTNPGDVLDYLEIIGKGQTLSQAPVPCIAIPTTSGTGSEVTRNAVLSSVPHKVKVSLRSPLMLPALVIVDPELTHSMPPAVTATTGLDALTQVMEPFVSPAANPMTDAFCRDGLLRASRSLHKAYTNGDDNLAREDMAMVSLLGGLALANAKLGAVHGFAGTLGGMFNAPHGAICAALLPHVMSLNVQALLARQPQSEFLKRYDEIGQILTGIPTATSADGVTWVQELCKALNLPGLKSFGLTPADFPTVIEKSAIASSMKGNPIKLTTGEMTEILNRAL